MNRLQQRLFVLDNKHREERYSVRNKNLRVFYGWSKINKIRKKEAISVIFENDSQREERVERFINRMQDTAYVRFQTDNEKLGADGAIRMYTEYSVFMDDKRINGSLDAALRINRGADSKNVNTKVLNEIEARLRSAYISAHPHYKEPVRQLELFSADDFE